MNLTISHKNKKINLEVEKSIWLNPRGLMFTRREKAEILLFDFGKSVGRAIHSWFVFFPFLAVWLDDKNKIIEIKKVEPWRFCVHPKNKFFRLVEIPCSKKYEGFVKILIPRRGLEKFK